MKRGAVWELALEIWHKEYAQQGKALVFHTYPATKMVAGRLIYAAKSEPDFVGMLAGGQAIACEAKEVAAGDRFSFAKLPEHQAQALTSVARMGGIAFVAVRFKELATDRLFRWHPDWMMPTLYQAWARGEPGSRASVVAGDGRRITEAGWLPIVGGW